MLLLLITHWSDLLNDHTVPVFCLFALNSWSTLLKRALVCKGLHFPCFLALSLSSSSSYWETVMEEWRARGMENLDYYILSFFQIWRASPAAVASLWFQLPKYRHNVVSYSTNAFKGRVKLLPLWLLSFFLAPHPLFGFSAISTSVQTIPCIKCSVLKC